MEAAFRSDEKLSYAGARTVNSTGAKQVANVVHADTDATDQHGQHWRRRIHLGKLRAQLGSQRHTPSRRHRVGSVKLFSFLFFFEE